MDDVHPLDRDDSVDPVPVAPRRLGRRFLDLTISMRLVMFAVAGAGLITWAARYNREHGDPEAVEVTLNLRALRSNNAGERALVYMRLASCAPSQVDRVVPTLSAALVEEKDIQARWSAAAALEQQLRQFQQADPAEGMSGLALRRLGDHWGEEVLAGRTAENQGGQWPWGLQNWGSAEYRLIQLRSGFGDRAFSVKVRVLCIGLHAMMDKSVQQAMLPADGLSRAEEALAAKGEDRDQLISWALEAATSRAGRPHVRLVGVYALAALLGGKQRVLEPRIVDGLLACATDQDVDFRVASQKLLIEGVSRDRELAKLLARCWREQPDESRAAAAIRALGQRVDEVEVYGANLEALGSDQAEVAKAAVENLLAMEALPAEAMPRLKAAVQRLDEPTRARVGQLVSERAARGAVVGP